MQATQYLAKLYDMPPEHGEVTAFDSYASHLYVGTDGGTVLHFVVEGIPESTPLGDGTGDSRGGAGGEAGGVDVDGHAGIFTNLVSRAVVSAQRQRVDALQHSRTQSLLFVLSGRRLTVWRTTATTTEPALSFLADIARGVGAFAVCPVPAASAAEGFHTWASPRPSLSSHTAPAAAHRREMSGASITSASTLGGAHVAGLPGGTAAQPSSPTATTQLIGVTEHEGRGLFMYEFNAVSAVGACGDGVGVHGGDRTSSPRSSSSNGGGGVSSGGGVDTGAAGSGLLSIGPHAVLTQELLLPEPALSLVVVNPQLVCVGLRQAYTLLTLSSGASRSLQRVTGSRPPLLALGERGELHMRHGKSIRTASLKGVWGSTTGGGGVGEGGGVAMTAPPSMTERGAERAGAGEGRVSTPRPSPSSQPPPLEAPQPLPSSPRTSLSASVPDMSPWSIPTRTRPTGEEPELVVSRDPFLFVFTEHGCLVFSVYEREPVERLPLAGVRFASLLARGGTVFLATRHSLLLLRLHPLRAQLADLVSCLKVDEAFELLAARRASTGSRLREVEWELRVMAGFRYVRHGMAERAIGLLSPVLDPRDLVVLVPECVPPAPDTYTPALRRLLEKDAKITGNGGHDPARGRTLTITREAVCPSVEAAPRLTTVLPVPPISPSTPCVDVEGGIPLVDYWYGWPGPCPYNSFRTPDELSRAWLQTFESYPFVPTPAMASVAGGAGGAEATRAGSPPPPPLLRQVPELGPVSSARFLEWTWAGWKAAMEAAFGELAARWTRGGGGGGGASVIVGASTGAELPLNGEAESGGGPTLDAETAARLRVVEFARLMLALERRDARAAYALVSRSNGLRVADCYDVLMRLWEYRLLAVLLWRHGLVVEAERLLRLGEGEEEWGTRVGPPTACRLAAAERARRGHGLRREVREGLALEGLPCAARAMVRDRLFADGAGRSAGGAVTHAHQWTVTLHGRGRGVTWVHAADPCAALLCLPVVSCGSSSACVPAPGDLAEVFVLLDRMDVVGLRAALAGCPALARCEDRDGRTLLHHTFAALSALERHPARVVLADDMGRTQSSSTRQYATDAAVDVYPERAGTLEADGAHLQVVLAAASMLVDYGCPVGCRSQKRGATCLDVAAAACGGVFLDMVLASLLSSVEVRAVAHAAVGEAAA